MFVERDPDRIPQGGGADIDRAPELSEHRETTDGLDIAERLRFTNTAEYQVDVQSILPDLHRAVVQLHLRQIGPATAREIVGATHELNKMALSHEDKSVVPLLDELKMATYHTTDVHPQVLNDQLSLGEAPRALGGETATFVWHGTPIRLRVRDPVPGDTDMTEPMGQGPNGSPDITLWLGERDTWLMQIGDSVPFPLVPNAPFKLGRLQLGKNSNVSRDGHVTLQATDVGIEVTGKEGTTTHFTTSDFPDPATWNLRGYMEDHRKRSATAARRRIDRAA